MSTHRISVALTDADYRALAREAEERGVEISDALAGVIHDGLVRRRERGRFGEALSSYGEAIGVDVADEAQRISDEEIAAMRAERRASRS